jgi:hypothetical protein
MVSLGEFTLDFSHIQRITQRSSSPSDFFLHSPDILFYRVVLSTIRNLGKFPSPRTLIQKNYIPGLGTTADDQRRQHIRLDDEHRQNNVELARKFIFEKGLGIKSKGVEGLLETKSYTPTRVWIFVSLLHPLALTNVPIRAPFLFDSLHSISIFFHCLSLISCMSSSSGYGKQCSRI